MSLKFKQVEILIVSNRNNECVSCRCIEWSIKKTDFDAANPIDFYTLQRELSCQPNQIPIRIVFYWSFIASALNGGIFEWNTIVWCALSQALLCRVMKLYKRNRNSHSLSICFHANSANTVDHWICIVFWSASQPTSEYGIHLTSWTILNNYSI